MANGQRPFSELFPPLPQGFQEPFWYASLQSFWLYYRVDPELLRERLPAGRGLEVALFEFGGGDHAGLASLDLQRYTGHGPTYLETTDEVEFNVYVYPRARVPDVPLMTWQQYLLGTDQTKTIGGYRLHVPCDNQTAVLAGRELYGEPKYLAVFDYTAVLGDEAAADRLREHAREVAAVAADLGFEPLECLHAGEPPAAPSPPTTHYCTPLCAVLLVSARGARARPGRARSPGGARSR
jgi:Acetoacetate decarboxylase (ADC)